LNSGSDVVIGVAGPLSGARVAHAPLLHRAEKRLRAHGIACRVEDDAAMPDQAVVLARRFVDQGVTAVIGHFNSACAQAVLPVYRAHGIPLLLPASSQTGLAAAGGAFRLCSTDLAQAARMLALADELGIPRAAMDVASDGTPYARRVLEALLDAGAYDLALTDLCAVPEPSIRLRLVLATCANALAASRSLATSGWRGRVVYADDAHVEEFFERVAVRSGLEQYVIGPHRDYGDLIEDACDLVARWRASTAARHTGASLAQWLTVSGRFTTDGDARDASWVLYGLDGAAITI
jgi:branched-chain amino acid transport system substrate-binding protein